MELVFIVFFLSFFFSFVFHKKSVGVLAPILEFK
jgi:hypothetical protein